MLINSYKDLLEKEGYLPLQRDKWKKVQIDHTVESAPIGRARSAVKAYIRNNTTDKAGIYIYESPKGQLMYIGQGGIVSGRLIDHYNESYQECKEPKYIKWYKFFGSYREVLNVYFCEIENYHDRIAIEAMLTRVLKPVYIGD